MPVSGFTPTYNKESPYGATSTIGVFLGYYIHRQILPQAEDILVTIDDSRYIGRPDRLAHDFYGNSNLWWVFGVRNGWEDVVHDLRLGTEMVIPPHSYVGSIL